MRQLATSGVLFAFLAGACTDEGDVQAAPLQESAPAIDEQEELARREGLDLRRFDLNRDEKPDIFKFYRFVDDPKNTGNKLDQLVRKEIDINHDGKIDVVRLYDDNQEVNEERTDLDFDGRFDEHAFYKEGVVVRKEVDLDYDGTADVQKFYVEGNLVRIESDRDGDGRTDSWEYYEGGELDRIGTDTDGDGEVDNWEKKREAKDEAAPAEEETVGGASTVEDTPGKEPAAGDASPEK